MKGDAQKEFVVATHRILYFGTERAVAGEGCIDFDALK